MNPSVIVSIEDNCGVDSVWLNPTSAICANDVVFYTLYARDSSGNIDSCSHQIFVKDRIAPSITCKNTTVYLDAKGKANFDTSSVLVNVTDNCELDSVWLGDTSAICSDISISTTVYAKDKSGNIDSCVSMVLVKDTILPKVSCKNINVYLDATGNAMITANQIDNGSTDECGISFKASKMHFTCKDVGANKVTLIVTDYHGNVDSCESIITVIDTVPPTVDCQNITIFLDSNGKANIAVADVDAGSTDACGIASLLIDKTSFDCNDLGVSNITLTVTDFYGNVSTCISKITVNDGVFPTIICPSNKQIKLENLTCTYIIPDYTAEVLGWDNCSLSTVKITQTPNPGSEVILNRTDTTIVIKITDGSDNTTTCSFKIYAKCVKELFIPQFISPNGSGKNDTWEISGLEKYSNNTVKVFNRWGNLVFEKKGYYTGWNGEANVDKGVNKLVGSKILPSGTYYYIIDIGIENNEPYVGYIYIQR